MPAIGKKHMCGCIITRHCRLQRDEGAHFIANTEKFIETLKTQTKT